MSVSHLQTHSRKEARLRSFAKSDSDTFGDYLERGGKIRSKKDREKASNSNHLALGGPFGDTGAGSLGLVGVSAPLCGDGASMGVEGTPATVVGGAWDRTRRALGAAFRSGGTDERRGEK